MSFFGIPDEITKKKAKVSPPPGCTRTAEDPEVVSLYRILQALKPIFRPLKDGNPNPFTRCAYFTPARNGTHGYLVATNIAVLVAVRIPENLVVLLKEPETIRLVANCADLQDATGAYYRDEKKLPTVAFGTYNWVNLPGERLFPDWTKVIPTTRLDENWTAKFDPAQACLIDDAVKGALKALGKDTPQHVSAKMLGDSLNNTTARVYADENALALLMPLLLDENYKVTKQAVLDFVKEAR